MKIYNKIVFDFDFNVIEEDSYEYDGEIAKCEDDGWGDSGTGFSSDSNSWGGGSGSGGGSNGNFNAGIDPSTGQLNMDAAVQDSFGKGSNDWMFNSEQGQAAVAAFNSAIAQPAVQQQIAKLADKKVADKTFSWSSFLGDVFSGGLLGATKAGLKGIPVGAVFGGLKNAWSVYGSTAKDTMTSLFDSIGTSGTTGLTGVSSPSSGGIDLNSVWNGSSFVSPTGGAGGAGGAGGNVAASWQQKAVDYLIERGEIPNQFRDEALKRLGGLAGLEGGVGSQTDLIDKAKGSPLYAEIMGNKKAGEDAILRNASATGGLRSGDVNANMYDFNVNLQNKALLDSYNQQLMGLQGLAGLSGDTNAIASGMSNIGTTLQAGINRDQEIGFEQAYANQARKDQQKKDERNEWLGIASIGAELFSNW